MSLYGFGVVSFPAFSPTYLQGSAKPIINCALALIYFLYSDHRVEVSISLYRTEIHVS